MWLGSLTTSNYHRSQAHQSKILRKLSHLSLYVPNFIIHHCLTVSFVHEFAITLCILTASWQNTEPTHTINFLTNYLHRSSRCLKCECLQDLLLINPQLILSYWNPSFTILPEPLTPTINRLTKHTKLNFD